MTQINTTPVNLIATATMGLEALVAKELNALGMSNIKIVDGQVHFTGTLKDICMANLWLRTSDRILLKVGEFEARTFDELFDKTKFLPWGNFISRHGKFPVAKISSVKSKLFSKSDCQAIIKKAVATNLLAHYRTDRLFETGADFAIHASIRNNKVTLSIDTTGEALHKRGYRESNVDAPIKETLAAAMIMLTGFKGGEMGFLDPTCGTGTLLIEAAMIARNMAPGGNRYFSSERWPLFPEGFWAEVREESYDLENPDADCHIYGSDVNERSLSIANFNVKRAGFADCITLTRCPVSQLAAPRPIGVIISNPPYGDRLLEKDAVEALYKGMGEIFAEKFAGWHYGIITSYEGFEKVFGYESTRNRKLFNGGIKCYYYQYFKSNGELQAPLRSKNPEKKRAYDRAKTEFDRKPRKPREAFGSDGGERRSFRSDSDRENRPFRKFSDRGFSRDDRRDFRSNSDREQTPFRQRPGSDRPSFKSGSDRDSRPFRQRSEDRDKPFKSRFESAPRPFRERSEEDRKPFKSRFEGDKPFRRSSENAGYSDKPRFDRERRSFRERSNEDRRFSKPRSDREQPFRFRSEEESQIEAPQPAQEYRPAWERRQANSSFLKSDFETEKSSTKESDFNGESNSGSVISAQARRLKRARRLVRSQPKEF